MNRLSTFIFNLLILGYVIAKPIGSYPNAPAFNGVGFAFTGAGGRIGQLNALAQILINGTYPNGTPIVPSYLAGVSSGALTAVALNAALETTQQNIPGGFNFGDLNNLLFTTTNDDIYEQHKGVRLIQNVDDGYILDSDPESDYISDALKRLGYSVLGDLYLPTYITVVDQRSGVNLRLLSTDPQYASVPLLDILLATTAIPVAFSPRPIPAISPFTQFIDGGSGIDYVPVIPLLSLPGISSIYVITYNNAFGTGVSDDSLDAQRGTLVKYALRAYNIQGANVAVGALAILAASNVTGYVYEPNFEKTFSTTDFNSIEEQYNLAEEWGTANAPTNVEQEQLISVNTALPVYTSAEGNDGNTFDTNSASSVACSMLVLVSLALTLF